MYKIHAYAEMFPEMTAEEFDRLCMDIEANGQRTPIDLYNNVILDGRNRYKACLKLGIVPKTRPCFPSDPLDFVLSANLSRRHLTTSQRAMLGAKLKAMQRPTKADILSTLNDSEQSHLDTDTQICVLSNEEIAKVVNVSERSITTANQILEEQPEKVADIEAGKITLNDARPQKAKVRIPKTADQISTASYKAIARHLSDLNERDLSQLGIDVADRLEAIEKPSG